MMGNLGREVYITQTRHLRTENNAHYISADQFLYVTHLVMARISGPLAAAEPLVMEREKSYEMKRKRCCNRCCNMLKGRILGKH